MNTFKKEDLKTGMRVTIKGGASYVVFKDVATSGTDYETILVSCNSGHWHSSGLSEFVEIIKVEVCLTPSGWAKVTNPEGWGSHTMDWKTIFEKEEISPLQKDFDELQSQIQALQEKANTIQQQINN